MYTCISFCFSEVIVFFFHCKFFIFSTYLLDVNNLDLCKFFVYFFSQTTYYNYIINHKFCICRNL